MNEKFVVTISHLLGCGGAAIGAKLADSLSIPFVDRQILKQVAESLNIPEEEIEDREEKIASFWESFIHLEAFGNTMLPNVREYFPTDRELFQLESEFIEQIAQKSSAVILGRGGRYILRNHPRHMSVFVHANMDDRVQRVSSLFNVSENESKKIIEKNDRERNAYVKTFTHLEWLDARTYDICVNTSSVGFDNAAVIIKNSLEYKIGQLH